MTMSELSATVHDTVTAVNRNQWNNLVEQAEHGTAFHRYGWLRAIEEGLGRPPRHAVVSKGENPVGILPNFVSELDVRSDGGLLSMAASWFPTERLVSVHPGFGGPLVLTDPEECLDGLFDALDEARGGREMAHRLRTCDLGYTKFGKYLAGRGFEPTVVSCRFEIDLTADWETLEAEMDKTRRNALRSGRESDVSVSVDPFTDGVVDETHEAYERNMDRVDGTTYPRSFFRSLAAEFDDRMQVFTAERDGEVLGRYVCVRDDEQSSLRYFFSAIPEEDAYEHNVSELLHTRAMRWGKEQGYETYDLGATGADFTDGLFKYKEKYGGEVRPILQWDRGLSPVAWNAFKLGRRVYRKTAY